MIAVVNGISGGQYLPRGNIGRFLTYNFGIIFLP